MNNNFITLTNDDIIIYNNIQSKIYKYFINFHKCSGIKFDELIKNTSLNQNEIYKISQDYCKDFKYNICLCNRYSYKNCLINDNYNEIYKCNNKKRILYNINNFNFTNPINLIKNNEKIFPIDIFFYYRQEYIPFIINEEFIKYKNKQSNIKLANDFRLTSLFYKFKNYKNKKINKQSNIKLANDFRLTSLFYKFVNCYNYYKNRKINKQTNIKLANDFRLTSLFYKFINHYNNHKNRKINKQSNIKLANDFRLTSLFKRFKEFIFKDDIITLKYFFKLFYSYYIYNKFHNLYNNELINVFDTKSFLLNDIENKNNDKIELTEINNDDNFFDIIGNNNDKIELTEINNKLNNNKNNYYSILLSLI
jgi:hypothetical protein